MSDYERLTKRGGVEKIEDFKEECGYSTIYQRLSVLEDMLESGELVELPRKSKVYIGDGDLKYRVVYLGIDKEIHSTFFEYERQADSFVEAEKARMRRMVSNE